MKELVSSCNFLTKIRSKKVTPEALNLSMRYEHKPKHAKSIKSNFPLLARLIRGKKVTRDSLSTLKCRNLRKLGINKPQ